MSRSGINGQGSTGCRDRLNLDFSDFLLLPFLTVPDSYTPVAVCYSAWRGTLSFLLGSDVMGDNLHPVVSEMFVLV